MIQGSYWVSYVVRNEVGWVRIRSRPPSFQGSRACVVGTTVSSRREKIRFALLLREIAVSESLVDAG